MKKIFYLLLITSPILGALPKLSGNITTKTAGNIISQTHNQDTVSFVDRHRATHFSQLDLTSYAVGLSSPAIAQLINQQNYSEALKYLWAEKNKALVIEWLKAQVSEGHPIFMFELCKELLEQNKTGEAMHMFIMGCLRTEQDARCCDDNSAPAAVGMLAYVYTDKKLQDKALYTQTLKQVAALLSANSKYPSPKWVGYHGMRAFFGEPPLRPASSWDNIRKEIVTEALKKIASQESKAKETASVSTESKAKEAASASCASCNKSATAAAALKLCGRCRKVRYCNAECQQAHWQTHKLVCKK